MKHGIIAPPSVYGEESPANLKGYIKEKLRTWRNFVIFVISPTVLFSGYLYFIAADRFETTSQFIVKSGDGPQASAGAFGDMLGFGVKSQSQTEILSVPEYLRSHEAVSMIQQKIDLINVFRRPEADLLSRLHYQNPEPEELLKYYRSMINVRYDNDTGIVHLSVQSFRPQDSFDISHLLLQIGERKINDMNKRSYEGAIASAQQQLTLAEDEAAAVQRKITVFRQSNRDIDPELSGAAQIKLVSELNGRLAGARAQLGAMAEVISPDSPQYQALARQVQSLEVESAVQVGRMGGGKSKITPSLGEYEELKIRQEFASKNYISAAANLQRAIEQARKQQLYFVRIVNPNLPVKSLYPKREKSVLTLFVFLTIAYAIGWLLIAGVREHES